MLATIIQQHNKILARFERPLAYDVQQVWAVLTENHHLKRWMRNLEIIDARPNGKMHFHMLDGADTFIEMAITDFKSFELLSFEWGNDHIRFELQTTEKGTLLILTEFIDELTAHTAKDLAGWQICLQLFTAILENPAEDIAFPMDDWQRYYEQYKELLNR